MGLAAGTKLGAFEIVAAIGKGGMGEVYRARDTKLDRDVAIKVLPESLAQDRELSARFEREAKTLASLDHPNIAALHEFCEESGIRFLVMQLVDGETLAARIGKGPLPIKEAIPLFVQIAEGLEAAHEKGIVHRDLKPANIKITEDEKIKILDFGIAKAMEAVAQTSPDQSTIARDDTPSWVMTSEGVVIGTPAYMSPEQARGKPVDKRTDIWAFGCCLYEALTSRSPFHSDTQSDTLVAILERQPDWDLLPLDMPEFIGTLIRRCLEKESRRRWGNVGDIGIQLEEGIKALEAKREGRTPEAFDELLAWRPEPGEPIPGREHWKLEAKLGEGGFGEVWLAAHGRTKAKRVFKFCFDPDRVKGLRREVVLFRLLKESLGDRDDIAHVLEWEFDRPPYFLEIEYTEGGDLAQWAKDHGGLANVPLETRLDIVAQIAVALGAAHSAGVLHKDIKPGNILIAKGTEREVPRVRLSDFGIGVITDPGALAEKGITAVGLTAALSPGSTSSGSGTHMYMAPELIEGKEATTRSDLYSLGVVLYQIVIGDFSRAVAPGWERDVEDELLREDIAACIDGIPERRLKSAAELAERLQNLQERRSRSARDRRAGQRRKALALATVAIVLGAIVAVAIVAPMRRNAAMNRVRAEDIPRVIQLIEREEYRAAFELAEQVERILPDDPILAPLWDEMSNVLLIETEPDGAEVYYREVGDVQEEWRLAGATPIPALRLPRGGIILRS